MIIPENFSEKVLEAVEYFWNTRSSQGNKQAESSITDKGNRSKVTGGKQLDGFVDLLKDILVLNGVGEDKIFTNSDLELPGYFRPNKKWDLLVVDNKRLIVAIELKSQVGPSFGNNFNNRTEEAMGSALDIWTAYREGAFGSQPQPWLGYLMVLEDCDKSSVPVKNRTPHFPVFSEFEEASYKKRYELFCKKLMLERQYAATCFMTTKNEDNGYSFEFPNMELSMNKFIASMLGAIFAYRNGDL